MRERGASQADLARASGVPQNVISKWLNGQVDEASPRSLKRIAPILGLSYEDLLRRMGELPSRPDAVDADPLEQYIRQRIAEMREAVRDTPRATWATIVKYTFDHAIAGARDMAQLLADQQSRERPVRKRTVAPAKASSAHPSYGGTSGGDQLKTRQRVATLVLAGA